MSSALNDIASPQAAAGYFVDTKKGEVNELKQLLKNLNVERDIRRKREIIKKVIAYMTLGIDVKRLFTDMIMAVETKDIVIKKMVYFYLSNYANSEPDLAIMCINTLRRDCDNEDPLIRGLALRSLCSLRLESILEYVTQPLQKSFSDVSAYVRKAAVMGVLKLHYLSPQLVETNGYLNQLYVMLQDQDSAVVTNAIYVINEMKIAVGGIEISSNLIMALLNRIGEFSEWGLNMILDLVSRYQPQNEEEMYGIMNLLDPILRTANSGSVMATVKCFFSLANKISADMYTQVVTRCKPPLLTIITGSHPEAAYMALKHVQLLLQQPFAKGVLEEDFRQFFIRYNEPPHLKHLKVDLLPYLANDQNVHEIATELHEYVTDVDGELSRRAIIALGEMIATLPAFAEHLTNGLLGLMEMESSPLRAQVAIVLCDIIRVHPTLSNLILPSLEHNLRRLDGSSNEAKASLIWILGEFAAQIVAAPYILAGMVDNYEEESSVTIKLQLLTSCMKVFFIRAPEMQRTLGKLLKMILNDPSDQDLHDKGLLYYRLLASSNPGNMKAIESLFTPQQACQRISSGFAENKEEEGRKKVFQEFNTLSVIYGQSSDQFVGEKYQLHYRDHERPQLQYVASSSGAISGPPSGPPVPVVTNETPLLPPEPTANTVSAPIAAPVAAPASVNLLDWDDGHGHGHAAGATQHATPSVASAQPFHSSTPLLTFLDFQPDRMSPPVFQSHWTSLPDGFTGRLCLLSFLPSQPVEFEHLFRHHKIFVLASGAIPAPTPGVKFFLYAHVAAGTGAGKPAGALDDFLSVGPVHNGGEEGCFCAQLLIYQNTQEVQVTVKATPATLTAAGPTVSPQLVVKFFLDKIVEALHPLHPQIV